MHSAENRESPPTGESARAERFLVASSLALMTLAVFLARNFDDPLLQAVYRLTHAENAAFWRAISLLGSGLTLTPVVAAVVLSLVWRGKSMSALGLAMGWAATSLTVAYLKWLLDRDRPPVTPWSFARGDAFPSGHAAQAAYVYLSLALRLLSALAPSGSRLLGKYLGKICWLVLLGLPAVVGYSRIALGVHWPSDVLGGWAVGLFFCALALVLWKSSRRQGNPSQARRGPGVPGESGPAHESGQHELFISGKG